MNKGVRIYNQILRRVISAPGEPEKSERAGMAVFGGRVVLSAILAQSLMMVNLP